MGNDQEASSSNSSNSNSTPKTWKYDIFLSFRGEDTRRGFTDHLYHALKGSRFRVFRDDDELPRGEVISQELKQAIENSNFAIVILSKNYASSSWCLDELQHILDSRENLCQVFPIFYDVDPSDVRSQRGSFDEAFKGHQHKFPEDPQKVQKWRDFLTKVANLSGFDSRQYRYETELIDSVVDRLWVKLHSKLKHVSVSEALIGIEPIVELMLSLLGVGWDDARFIGLWGMGGVGKTTHARAIYERFHNQFDFHCFLENVRELSERYDLPYLQKELLSRFNKSIKIEDINQGKKTLGFIFRNKKVMLILDDVDHISQLEELVGSPEWFGDGSKIIITTRDVHLLHAHQVDVIYEVQPMDNKESLQLFCQKAFRRSSVPHDDEEKYRQLALSAINYASGLPVALCVFGSFFCGRDGLTEWKDALDMLRVDSNNDIFNTLRISYFDLNDTEKMIFLDIACFFSMWGKDEIIQILESCGLPARTVLHILREKSLLAEIKIGNTTYIQMHDLIQEMGRLIVIDESRVCIGRRNRLWLPDDIDQLLERDMGTEATQGMVLPHSFEKDEVCWHPEAFLKLHWLRLLIILCNFDLSLHLKGLPGTLKVLHWYGYPIETLPSKECMDQLVYLKMQNSKLKRLSRQSMKKLKILDLSHSKNLLKSPNFLAFQNLERLILEGCTSLHEIDSSLGQLHCLIEVNLKGCLNLKVLPKKLEMNSLVLFVLGGCIQVRNLPEFGERMEKLITLDAKETSIAKLPESLGYLTSIETLDLKGCQKLVGLPHTIHKLKFLKVLDISGCSTLSELPKNLDKNEALEKLDASGTSIVEVPPSICYLKELKTLAFHGCKMPTSNSRILSLKWWNKVFQKLSFSKGLTLPASIFNIESLRELDLSFCNIVDGIIPNDISGLSSLKKLDLSGNEFVNLPDGCISYLLNLCYLYLNSCPKLEILPQLSPGLDLMDAGECGSLRTMSDKKMLHIFASIGQDGQQAKGLRTIKTFSLTIPGSEIPSWYANQNHLPVNEKHVASVTIDIPEDDWLGLGLCTVIDDKICWPCWGFDFKASDGKYVSLPGRRREHEKEIKSCHLWMVFWKIKEENRVEVSGKYSQIRLKFCSDWEQPPSASVDIESIKCGWRFIRKGDLELLKDGENTISSGEEHRECNLLQGEASQTIIRECETSLDEGIREDEVEVDESWKQFIADDSRPEAELNETVVEEPWTKLCSKLPPYCEDLIGIENKIEQLEPLLKIGLNDVRFVGIWGSPGVGKTTIARAVFDKYRSQFEIKCFLHNVRATSERDGEVHLQSKLLSHLKIRNMEIEDTFEGKKIIQNNFRDKKVLLILDDVCHTGHLENLANSPNWFGAGSRVIITTRDSGLLCRVHEVHTHEVQIMNPHESFQLFCSKAFKRGELQVDLLRMSKTVCDYAKGLPLALSVLGSFFGGRSSLEEWEDALDKLKKHQPDEILRVLQLSFDALDEPEKIIFLDIACFFNGWSKKVITHILESCGFNVKIGITTLQEKSMLKDYDDCLVMHDLLEEMGRRIAIDKSPDDVGNRSRLWYKEDIDEVMENNLGTKEIQGMVSSTSCEASWDPKAFSKFCNLRLLIITSDFNLPHGLKCLPHSLKVLHWTKYPLDTLPPESRLDELVDLKMRHSKLKKLWNKSLCSMNLKFLDLSYSKNLIETPDFFELPNLERLELEGCEDIVDLHASVGQHTKLCVLNLKGCKKLKNWCIKKLEMTALKEFVLCGCIQIKHLPEFGESMKHLEILDAGETNLVKLPESLGLLTGLETLKLRGCKNLVCLPESIYKLKRSLVFVDIAGCSRFARLPENLNGMEALEEIDASETDITEVPSSIGGLNKIKKLSFRGFKRLTSNSWKTHLWNLMFWRHSIHKGLALRDSNFNLKSLKKLNLSYCNIDDGSVPDSFNGLSSLKNLNLSGNLFKKLHAGCISDLLKLKHLYLNSCSELESLPQLGPNLYLVDAKECGSFEAVSDEQLSHLFASFNQGETWTLTIGENLKSIMGESRAVTIPGSEIPSWFENQNDLCLDDNGKGLMEIDIPPCGEGMLGIALCTVLDHKASSTGTNKSQDFTLNWEFIYCSTFRSYDYMPRTSMNFPQESSHLWILFWKPTEELRDLLQAVKYSRFPLAVNTFPRWAAVGSIIKCGWRVICKGDFENWGYSMSQSPSSNGTTQ